MEKKKLLILAPVVGPKQSFTTGRLVEEAKKSKRFDVSCTKLSAVVLRIEKNLTLSYKGTDLSGYDYYLPRIDSKRLAHGYAVVRFLDQLGLTKPYSAQTLLIAHNKFITLEVLKKAGIPVPDTWLIGSAKEAGHISDKFMYPLIIKHVAGFGGKGVYALETPEAAKSLIESLVKLGEQIIVEEFIPTPGEDMRAFVVGDEVVASMKRIAKRGEDRANIYSGGRAVSYRLSKEQEDLALLAAKAIGADICAVDLMDDARGRPKVIEVNINPGIRALEKVSQVNVAQHIIDHISQNNL